jgi:hypothetical protein
MSQSMITPMDIDVEIDEKIYTLRSRVINVEHEKKIELARLERKNSWWYLESKKRYCL